jgi:hypothetical protein
VTIQKMLTKGVKVYTTIASGTIVATTDGTAITFLNNPQPIPEIPQNMIIPLFAATTLLTIIVYRKKLQNTHKQQSPSLPFCAQNSRCTLLTLEQIS